MTDLQNQKHRYEAIARDEEGELVRAYTEVTNMDFNEWKYKVAVVKLMPKGETVDFYIDGVQQLLENY